MFIVEDSSFVVALLHKKDPNHNKALLIFQSFIYKFTGKIKILIPSIVFFETLFTLLRLGTERKELEIKLWRLLQTRDVINVNPPETSMLRYATHMENLIESLPPREEAPKSTADAIVVATAVDFDAMLLTFDKKMCEFYFKTYKDIYCPLTDEQTKQFFEKLSKP